MSKIKKELYSKSPEWFLSYIEQTNQKQILIENIKKTLEMLPIQADQDFVFTDIGAGNGVITLPIVHFLNDEKRTHLTTNVIEYSDALAAIIQRKLEKDNLLENTNIYCNHMEDVAIPESDFILAAHVLLYLDDVHKELERIWIVMMFNSERSLDLNSCLIGGMILMRELLLFSTIDTQPVFEKQWNLPLIFLRFLI